MAKYLIPALALAASFGAYAAPAKQPAQPKLVLVMAVDGLPQEQVTRYAHQFGQGGFRRLLEQGAWFSNAHQAHGITVTAVGHAAILSGAYPYQHGIIGNNWVNPATGGSMYCTEDANYKYVGNEKTDPHDGTSPANLRVDTLGDQLRYATGQQSKVVTVSGKDRGAILLGGKTGTAYMYMEESGNFASTTFYMKEHPQWVQKYQAGKPQERYYGVKWKPLLADSAYAGEYGDVPNLQLSSESGQTDATYYKRLKESPFLDELTVEFAQAAIEGENLGKNPAGVPDLLGVSFSAHDLANHGYGPESKISHDHLLRLDRMLSNFFSYIDKRIGMDNVLVVLTADHGFANTPEFANEVQKAGVNRIDGKKLAEDLNAHLSSRFGLNKGVSAYSIPNLHLDYAQIESKGLKREDVENAAARFLLSQPGLADVFTRTQMESGAVGGTRIATLMRRAWNRQTSGDLMVVAKPHWIFGFPTGKGTTHGSPYAYDTNVPLIVMGKPWVKSGHYGQYAEVIDIAPTLAYLLNVRPPAGAEGRVLTEALK
ncbi:alkaline phosphatase family protein [Duganella sp. Root336D2]|uniref:alkaline phosphatase family protein n=1 Tax=Duganella sp. Root336D2 TaxID=1736518 RepID=UPI0006F756FD|nr:alkaline phosphatase family protein [Duganella sp. Root336D2]KQV45884.1 alkaline phosphatase [Duganella sp. Root336D2]